MFTSGLKIDFNHHFDPKMCSLGHLESNKEKLTAGKFCDIFFNFVVVMKVQWLMVVVHWFVVVVSVVIVGGGLV